MKTFLWEQHGRHLTASKHQCKEVSRRMGAHSHHGTIWQPLVLVTSYTAACVRSFLLQAPSPSQLRLLTGTCGLS